MEPPPRNRPPTATTVFLLLVALVVAVAACGSVYAVMTGKQTRRGPLPPRPPSPFVSKSISLQAKLVASSGPIAHCRTWSR
ncbi:hypothetical protein EES41_19780 [Streptomyces sp. ADI95-16]|nr:hypothetical protein EES41_19780 [Streptomyces sp. ADI95-16]RPK47819.1 hypothetical protein EES37_09445 [Streptomyces sp. ADI91-18]GHD67668.1 hypothetical protein GCM10010336_31130 [Streptomyces goshikiensis]